MRDRGYADRSSWAPEIPNLLKQLLQQGTPYFAEHSKVLLLPFSEVVTDKKERRVALGPAPIGDVGLRFLEIAPPGGGATDMNRALDLGQRMLHACPHPGMIWLITDNENNFQGNQSDRQFYERLRDSPDYEFVYLFPLANPAEKPNDCLVMYLLIPPRLMDGLEAAELAAEVERRTGFGGMLFRPLYNDKDTTSLDFSKELTLDAPGKHKIEQEGGQTVLYYQEGEKLQGNLRFRIRSRLKGWKVEGATLEDAEVQLHIPSTYVGGSEQKLKWQVTPNKLEVEPEKDSLTMFSLQILGPGGKPIELRRRPGKMLAQPFASFLPEIQGDVRMKAVLHIDQGNLRHQVPGAMMERLKAVQGLAEIENYMLQQSDGGESSGGDREIVFQRKLIVRVKADPSSAILFAIAGLMGGLLLASVAAGLVFWRLHFQLEGPGIEEEFPLSGFWGEYLVCDGKGMPHCRLRSRLGSLTLVAEPDSVFEEERRTLEVRWEGDEFRFEVGSEGKPNEVFWLRRRRSGGGSGGGGDEAGGLL